MTKRVALYARVSTTRQAENDISIPDQLTQCRRYCATRGWHVVREFIDPGASARDDKRPQFQAMVEALCVDPSPADVVIVHSMSRFFRDAVGYGFWKRKLEKHGVSLLSITQDFGEGTSANFAETVLAAADQYHSEETAKHVTRTMLENARQGFWNGSRAPFGHRTVEAERRGQRIKKRLEIEPGEAETVRLIFRLFKDGDGTRGPMGVKQIASWLNMQGIRHRGAPFYTSAIHAILTRHTYTGTHYYNRHDSKTRRARPTGDWIAVPAPQIMPPAAFHAVQEQLYDRRPSVTPTRITTSDVLLTGIARCENCGAHLMLRTGKGGRYRYYACSAHRLKGVQACGAPIAVPEGQLDKLVIEALADHLLTPERLPGLLQQAQAHRRSVASQNVHRRGELGKQLKDTETQIGRLYEAVAQGLVDDTILFRTTLSELQGKREECARLLSLLDADVPVFRQTLSNGQAISIAAALKRRLLDSSTALRRRYVRNLVSDILVDRERALISGPPAAIAAAITSRKLEAEVRTSGRNWRARQDSNL